MKPKVRGEYFVRALVVMAEAHGGGSMHMVIPEAHGVSSVLRLMVVLPEANRGGNGVM